MEDVKLLPRQQYRGMKTLKRSGVTVHLTREHVEEIIKCRDVEYFIKNYVYITNMDTGVTKFELYPYQEKMIKHYAENRFSLVLTGRQLGKCVCSETIVTVRNKNTGKIEDLKISDLYQRIEGQS